MKTAYQNPLTLPTAEAVPPESQLILEGVKKKFGFIPNLMIAFSPSPAVLQAYLTLADLASKTSFTAKEQHAAALIISQELGCPYCLAAHGTLGQSVGLDKDTDPQIGEAVLLVTWKTLSNYTNHLYDTPIDDAFAPNAAPEQCGAELSACSVA
ncbi:MAG: AhpD family alkylhydroperoxidase [Akkermansiaceae bacterium]|jgi:AhpD family alkylhydroperoxidase